MKNANMGEFVQFHQDRTDDSKPVPAIIVAVTEKEGVIHLNAFTIDTASSNPVKQATNVPHISIAADDEPCWDYFPED